MIRFKKYEFEKMDLQPLQAVSELIQESHSHDLNILVSMADHIKQGKNFKLYGTQFQILNVTFEDLDKLNDKRAVFVNGHHLTHLWPQKTPSEIGHVLRLLHGETMKFYKLEN